MADPKEYCESWRRSLFHAGFGGLLVGAAAAFAFQGLSILLAALGAVFVLGGAWGLLRKALGRVDRLVLSDASLEYVNPARPAENRSVPLSEVQEVAIDTATVSKVRELRISVKLKDGRTWCFGERFMEARLLQEFLRDANERLSRL
ncbi:MAG: hypothetical protein MUC63_08750 [Planctomycetes bacterium]|nr:hypothetical protein [Planctomycetota bacterium]